MSSINRVVGFPYTFYTFPTARCVNSPAADSRGALCSSAIVGL